MCKKYEWRTLSLSGNWNLPLNLESVSSSKLHTSPRAWKTLISRGSEAAMSTSNSTGLSLDDNPVSSLLDLTSNIALRSTTKPLNQLTDWCNKGSKSANTTLRLLPSKTKLSIQGEKEWETPKEAPKCAKRNEIEGQTILTLELLTMETQKNKEREINPKSLETKKKRKRKKEREIKNQHNLSMP